MCVWLCLDAVSPLLIASLLSLLTGVSNEKKVEMKTKTKTKKEPINSLFFRVCASFVVVVLFGC